MTNLKQNFLKVSTANVNTKDLDAYHWLKDKEQVIVKFCQRVVRKLSKLKTT